MKRRDLLLSSLGAAAYAGLVPARSFAADITAVTLDGGSTTLTRAEVTEFADSLDGVLLKPDSAGYDIARQLWNRFWDRRPALIAHVGSIEDVMAAVRFARSHNLLTAVRCGGHSMSGKSVCDGGLVIDLSYLNQVDIDVDGQVAYVQGGCLLGDMDRKALPFGLGTTAGVVSHTGAGGLILGGGMGRLQRRFGLSIDNNLGVEMITADGKLVRANDQENQDLYWGVRGGGGNFGIVTQFKMQLHPINPTAINFFYRFPGTVAKDAMKLYFDFTDNADDDLFTFGGYSVAENGDASVSISGTYYGPPGQTEQALKALDDFGKATAKSMREMTYVDIQRMADDGVNAPGLRRYAKSGFLREINEDLFDTLIETAEPLSGRSFGVGFLPMDAAPARVAPEATAWTHRDALYNISTSSDWSLDDKENDERNVAWNRAYWKGVEPFTRGFYINSLSDQDQAQINENYGVNYKRLVKVKTAWDPDNFFSLNANVRPESA